MQEAQQAIPHWVLQLIQWLAIFIGGGTTLKIIELIVYRKKPIVEAQKVEAETTEITIRSHAAAGDSIIRLMNRLDQALNTIDRLRSERDDLRERTDKQEMELEFNERQMKRIKGLLDAHSIKFSELDEPK